MYNAEEEKKHTLRLENREMLEMDGICDVDAFNEEEIHAKSEMGRIVIKGSSLHIKTLELEVGTLKIEGKIDALYYSSSQSQKGFFRKAFS